MTPPLNLLGVSDRIVEVIYSPEIQRRFASADLVISCGDLPYYYLDYIISSLNVPLFFVRGNHANLIEYGERGPRRAPLIGTNLHRETIKHQGLLLAGIEGSLRYNQGTFQYSQAEMWEHALTLAPRLLLNRLIHGRALDILVTHAPPWGINDQPDPAHQGIKAFRWLLEVFKPALHLHGHIHLYSPLMTSETSYRRTRVINVYGYRLLTTG